jgi:hypothetical protein
VHAGDGLCSSPPQFLTQRYVAEPFLLHGRKLSLRFYLLLTSVSPVRLYVFEEGLAHLAVDKCAPPMRLDTNFTALSLIPTIIGNTFAASLRTDICPQRKESSSTSHARNPLILTFLIRLGV